jgi:hypothetical protein
MINSFRISWSQRLAGLPASPPGWLAASVWTKFSYRFQTLEIQRFDNLLEITWDLDKRFSDEGDSGGLVFTADSFAAVGLHFAGGILSVNGKKMGFSYSCNLKYLMDDVFKLKWIE